MIESIYTNSRILIVDDKVSNVAMLEDILEDSGYLNLKSTTDSREVVSLYKSFQPDIILLDLMMPFLSGYEVLQALKLQIPADTFMPILVLTADITTEAKLKALSCGAKDFLSKPFDVYEVRLRIKSLLETRYYYQKLQGNNLELEEKVSARTSELEKANQQLEFANKDLRVLDQAKMNFLQLISHEIRTPLNGILGFTNILKTEIHSPDLLEYLDCLEESAKRLEKFSYNALKITELLTRSYETNFEEVPLDMLLDNSKTLLREKLTSKGMKIVFQNDSSINHIYGDSDLLQICFDSLLDNAIKYSAAREDVLVHVKSENNAIICEFIDKGSGFSVEALGHLFSLFGLGDRHIDQNNGLNLALVKLIMDTHQGEIQVMNNKPKGASVRLAFRNA